MDQYILLLKHFSNQMHFITNDYKRFSKTNSIDPRQRVSLTGYSNYSPRPTRHMHVQTPRRHFVGQIFEPRDLIFNTVYMPFWRIVLVRYGLVFIKQHTLRFS